MYSVQQRLVGFTDATRFPSQWHDVVQQNLTNMQSVAVFRLAA